MPTSKASSSSVAIGNITGLGTNVSTFLATPSSANLSSAMTDKTGTGVLTFATSPTITGDLTVTGKLGINGKTPPTQASHIPDISSTRADDADATINGIIALLEANGIKAES